MHRNAAKSISAGDTKVVGKTMAEKFMSWNCPQDSVVLPAPPSEYFVVVCDAIVHSVTAVS